MTLNPKRKKRISHNYTSELELKSLLIRIKNDRLNRGEDKNNLINKYISWHSDLNNKKYTYPTKKAKLKNRLKKRIVELSEKTRVNKQSYERFGEIILLMIKNILRKPQFSGYTYKDDFYSDAIYKILKYLGNYNHKLISEKTGQPVNAFAYISQIIHMSILFIINTKKKENDRFRKHASSENLNYNIQIGNHSYKNMYQDFDVDVSDPEEKSKTVIETIELKEITGTLIDELKDLEESLEHCDRMNVIYPKSYNITFEEYNELKEHLKGKISIVRSK